MRNRAIVFIALITFSCTSLFGQKYVISLVHGDQSSPQSSHEHLYENWDQVTDHKQQSDAHSLADIHEHLCDCEFHKCFISVDGDHADVYSFKTLNELPVSNVLMAEMDLWLAEFNPVKSIVPADVRWLFDYVDRLERPPAFQLSWPWFTYCLCSLRANVL